MAEEALRQHYRIATGKGPTPAPNPSPYPNSAPPPGKRGTASNPFPNPMMKKSGRGR